MSERLDAIRQRLERIPPPPWFLEDDHDDTLERWLRNEEGTLVVSFGYLGNRTEDEADFVVNAPEDVKYLLGEVDRLNTIIEGMRNA